MRKSRLLGSRLSAACFSLLGASAAHAALVSYSFTTAGGVTPTEGTRATTTTGSSTPGTNTGFDAESPASGAAFSTLTSAQFAAAPQGYVTTFTGTTNDSSPAYTIDGHAFEVATNQMANISGAAANLTSGYVQFSVTPNAGNAVTYSSLTFDLGNDSNTTTTGSGSVGANLFASTDGTTFNQIGTTSAVVFDGTTKSIVVVNDISKDLSGLGTRAGAVTFRLALADASSNANNKFLFLDDIKLNGTIGPVPNHPLISLTAEGSQVSGYGHNTIPTLTVVGGSGSYIPAQDSGVNSMLGDVEVTGFNPGSDEEIYALKLAGAGANIANIINEINASNTGITAELPTPGIAAEFPGFQIELDANPGSLSSDQDFGFDLSALTENAVPNTVTITDIAVVPEPASAALLIGGASLLIGRRKRRS